MKPKNQTNITKITHAYRTYRVSGGREISWCGRNIKNLNMIFTNDWAHGPGSWKEVTCLSCLKNYGWDGNVQKEKERREDIKFKKALGKLIDG